VSHYRKDPPPEDADDAPRMYLWGKDGAITGYIGPDAIYHERDASDPRHVSEITHIVTPTRPPPKLEMGGGA